MGKVTWTERGVRNLRSIFEYIAVDSEIYAARFIRSIIEASEKLTSFPLMGRVAPEFAAYGLREVLFKNYRIVYRAVEDWSIIEIIAVVHASRDLLKLARDEWELQ
ncbi:MAG: type II toxin-antitoxin system RelE/ParE family toxin [Bacillota bacterium]